MIVALQKKEWASFAAKYNGKGYETNHYDAKLKAAYDRFKQEELAATLKKK